MKISNKECPESRMCSLGYSIFGGTLQWEGYGLGIRELSLKVLKQGEI